MSEGGSSTRRLPSPVWLAATVLLAGVAYRSLAVWSPAPAGLSSIETWLYLPSGTSPQLVLVLAGAALARRGRRIRAARTATGSPARAAPVLSAAVCLQLWATYVGAGDLLVVSLVLFVLGAVLLSWGTGSAREIALPLVIALFAIPMPAVLANQVLFPLQLTVAQHTHALLGALGATVDRSGDLLFTPTATVQVIQTCSGIRSMDVLTLLALVFVAFFQPGWRRGLLLVLAAPAIAYGVNVARVAWVTDRARGEVVPAGHLEEGLIVFAACVALLLTLDALLARVVPTPERVGGGLGRSGASGPSPGLPVLATVAGALAVASVAMPRWHPTGPRPARVELPAEVGGWQRAARQGPPWTPVASGCAQTRYELGGESVLVFVARDARLRRNRSLLSPLNAVPGPGWEIDRRWSVEPDARGPRFQAVLANSLAGRSLTWSSYQGLGSLLDEVARALLATDRSFLRRPGEASVLRLSTAVTPSPTGIREAEARLEAFLRAWREREASPRT